MQGTVNGCRRRGRQKKRWDDNIREWTGLELRNTLRKAEDREEWKAVVRRSSATPRRISNLRDGRCNKARKSSLTIVERPCCLLHGKIRDGAVTVHVSLLSNGLLITSKVRLSAWRWAVLT
ncbi:UDP-glucuronosyltransferase 2a1-like [Plakobranchus ocellatus]|uniref:UDP-glucuronosyltransferase 2a1-like n=1 Tax=Plakobranchus ocellatus TaxID=259542 RepID=A0AAV4AES9_9GAST|nr:UDP-glucuronosyltransferase 2a1-like [Plakobranchus ocellatus]